MKILLINVDSRFNLAIRRLYQFYLRRGDPVEMRDLNFSGYPHKKTAEIDASEYDKVYVSNIFIHNADRVTVTGCNDIDRGGVGSHFPTKKLPKEIEDTSPYYFPDEDTSVGFLTRGCIRNCWFCRVPSCEGYLKEYNKVQDIVKHKKATFLDNNILAYDKHEEVFKWLIHRNIKCDFNQGLDWRLITPTNADLLSRLNYSKEYIFAFDDPSYLQAITEKLKIIKYYISTPWKVKFYCYYHPKMELSGLIQRVEWCRSNQCLPYVMRDSECWNAPTDIKNFLIDYAAYCNQPGMFKKETFEQFLFNTRIPCGCINEERAKITIKIYEDNTKTE